MELSQLDAGHNRALRQIILERIREAGSISFAEFMSLALYHPRHGYYLTCDPMLDYQSSPHVHPVFGAAIARQLADFWRALGRPARFDVLEAGAGDGRLAADVLSYLKRAEPDCYAATRYVMQDVAYVSATAKECLEALALPGDRIEVTSELPPTGSLEGCFLSNELFDALPFHRVRVRDGRLYELRVGLNGDAIIDVGAEPPPEIEAYFATEGLLPGEGCDAEVNLEAPRLLARAAACLRRGFLLILDYGYDAASLYAPWRKRGTLLTFYRHTAGDDPYARIGRQDITASVDFTSLTRAGEEAGLVTLGRVSQADFLVALGIGEALSRTPDATQLEAYYTLRRAAIELTDMSGLGRIQVLVQCRGLPTETKALGLAGRSVGG